MSGGMNYSSSGANKPTQQQQQQQQQPLGYAQQPPIVVPASLGVVPQSALANVIVGQAPQPKRRRKEREVINQHGARLISIGKTTSVGRGVARRWNEDEELQLRRLVEEVGPGKWPAIAERLATGRTPSGVEQHWQIMTGQRKRTVKLHKDSDAPTMNQQRHHHHMNSSSSSMQQQQHHHHHHHQLQQHDQRVSVAHVVHRWTVDEEARLRALVQEIGKGKWSKIAERLGTGRSASGVEQHWQIMIGQRKRNSSAKTPPYKPPATQQHIVSSSSSLSPSLCPTPAPSLGHPARPTFGDGDGIVAHRGESHGRSEHQLPRSQAHSPPSVIGPRSYPAGAVTVSAPPPSLEKSPSTASGADELSAPFLF